MTWISRELDRIAGGIRDGRDMPWALEELENLGARVNDMELAVALRDDPEARRSAFIGVFSTEKLAQAACQEDAEENEDDESNLVPVLVWDRGSADLADGSTYDVFSVTLNERTGI